MAFIAEDGTGLEGANAMIDLAFADGYFEDRGQQSWTELTVAEKQSAIVQATDYLELLPYSWQGSPLSEQQSLIFPRTGLGLPLKVKRAVALYALRASIGPLLPDNTISANGQAVLSESKTLGPLSTSTTYADPSASKRVTFRAYPEADNLLIGFIDTRAGGYGQGQVIR